MLSIGLRRLRKRLGRTRGYKKRFTKYDLWLAILFLAVPKLVTTTNLKQKNESNDLKTNDKHDDTYFLTYDNHYKQIKNESYSNGAMNSQTNKENESKGNIIHMAIHDNITESNQMKKLHTSQNKDASATNTHNTVQKAGRDRKFNKTQHQQTSDKMLKNIIRPKEETFNGNHYELQGDIEINNKLDSCSNLSLPKVEKKNAFNVNENRPKNTTDLKVEQRDITNAIDFGVKALEELLKVKEPQLYKLGLFLDSSHPAARVAGFGSPKTEKAILISRIGYATLEASKKIAQIYPENVGRQSAGIPEELQSRIDLESCPFRGRPRCPPASRRFRTSDGTCNNLENPSRGSAMLPLQRFLPPVYEDGIQSVRRSVFGDPLPSPRQISSVIHRDRNQEIKSVTMMFTQWGQFIDHDITSTVKSRSFNGTIPRCCEGNGERVLPPEFLHPSCLPIEVPLNDPFLSHFGVGCMEFIRSAPSTTIDCELGWREQINQVTPFIDASTIYGSDIDTSDSIRTFRNGQIIYGRSQNQGPLNPPDPPNIELCRAGALSDECLQPGDARVSENPGLVAIHTIFVRYHNKIAAVLAKINLHWSDERVFQETRRIVYSVIQHITYREYLPVVLGPEVMDLFQLRLLRKGYYDEYNKKIDPSTANSFSTAAFRFGHSMIQSSYMRTDSHHIPIPNNVSLHNEFFNFENIWSFGSVDRLLLGFSNQPSQKRDEFISEELTNHLFQFSDNVPGMDLAAINIQRGRDHGIPQYTSWRKPCGLSPINNWRDLESVMSLSTVIRLRTLYLHVDDIDLFTGGLAEKPLRGAVVGPTFACIIAQQFSILRNGDRFWYENEGFESSFSPAQLQQIRKVSLAQIICQTMDELETIQPFVFLSVDNSRNVRISCDDPEIRNFNLGVWSEKSFDFNSISDSFDSFEQDRSQKDTLNFNVRRKRESNNTGSRISAEKEDFKYLDSNSSSIISPTLLHLDRDSRSNKKRIRITTLKPDADKTKTATTSTNSTLKLTKLRPTTTKSNRPLSKTQKLKYNEFNKAPQNPTFTHSTSTRRTKIKPHYYQIQDQNHDDVTYLVGILPEHSTKASVQPAPIQVNININYSPAVSPVSPTTNKKKRPLVSSGTSYVTSKPLTKPTKAHGESDVIIITKRPSTSTRRPTYQDSFHSTYDRPYTYDLSTKKPTYFYDNSDFVTSKRPNMNAYSRPTDVFQRPITIMKPNYYDNVQYSNTPTVLIRPIEYRPTTDHRDTYDNDQKPIYISTSDSHYRPVFENRPFSSSNNNYYNDKTTTRPFSNYYFDNDDNSDTVVITDNRRRPQTNSYNRDDNLQTDEILNEFFNRHGSTNGQSGNGGTRSGDKPDISDKLDFKSRLIYRNTDDVPNNSFVQISSVKKEEYFGREGTDSIQNSDNIHGNTKRKGRRSLKRLRIVEVDVTPSEYGISWKIFNATDEPTSLMEVPELPSNLPCSYEVPKPMTKLFPSTMRDKKTGT